jgi:hypothetical protein
MLAVQPSGLHESSLPPSATDAGLESNIDLFSNTYPLPRPQGAGEGSAHLARGGGGRSHAQTGPEPPGRPPGVPRKKWPPRATSPVALLPQHGVGQQVNGTRLSIRGRATRRGGCPVYAHATHCVPHEAVLTPKHSTESAVTPTRARPGFGDSTALARRWLAERVDLLRIMPDLAGTDSRQRRRHREGRGGY